MIDGVMPKSPTTEPRCHSDQVDPLVCIFYIVLSMINTTVPYKSNIGWQLFKWFIIVNTVYTLMAL